jgi:hypothetical protein
MLQPTKRSTAPSEMLAASAVGAHAASTRLEHQGPTSHEVGMRKHERKPNAARNVGWSIKDPPLTRWVCAKF